MYTTVLLSKSDSCLAWKKWTSLVRGLKFQMFCSAWRRLRGDFTAVYSFLSRGSEEAGTDFFSLVTSDRTQGNSMKLCQERLRLDIRKSFFTQGVFGYWNRLPSEVVTAPNLIDFKKHLDKALRYLVGLLGCPVQC